MRLSFKEKRNKAGLTQKELGIAVGLAEISIRKLENGERDPSINTAVKISKALNSNMEEIFPDIFLNINDTKCILIKNHQK
ncbi:helix-turn-helix transcriptional regulator [Listeria innocua]|nr:helix-turn-helix transcriptional regulator [Listeria innocua]MBM5686062.1 XRE family transcriptional regulator [Listeria innocua]MBM5701099.1 XRE family transcriptional regulator [Listeria innocua]